MSRLNKKDYNKAVQCLIRYDYNTIYLDTCIKEYKAVEQAMLLLNNESRYIFEEEFRKKRNKWDIINELHISEETYKRRRKILIYTVSDELKRLKKLQESMT